MFSSARTVTAHVRMHSPWFFAGMFLYFSLFTPYIVLAASEYNLEIIKSAQELRLKQGEQIIKTFHIAYGKGDKGRKKYLGDDRTPVGSYRIADFNPASSFYYFMQIDYPNLLDAWHGYQDGIITSSEFKQIALAYRNHQLPPQNTHLGGNIGIHGLGDNAEERLELQKDVNWTRGCIALKNEEINVLRQYVTKGTLVVIKN